MSPENSLAIRLLRAEQLHDVSIINEGVHLLTVQLKWPDVFQYVPPGRQYHGRYDS